MTKQKLIIDLFSDSEVQRLNQEEITTFEEKWVNAFCNYSKSDRAEIYLEQFKWHTFSYEKYPALCGVEATKIYLVQLALNYIVLPETQAHEDEIAFSTSSLPDIKLAELLTDFYVFPKNLAWTIAFTHESGWLGPYFAKHSNYEKLNRSNLQAYEARQKGW